MLRDVSAPQRTRDQVLAALVAAAPPLGDEQRNRLAAILRPVEQPHREAVKAA